MSDLSSRPWWTPADDAELDLRARELVDEVFAHRERCALCATGYPPCPHVTAAIEAVVDWRELRILRSLAAWLRAGQDRLEEGWVA
jgi:hypothetical protein